MEFIRPLLLAFISASVCTAGNTFYVSPSGGGSNPQAGFETGFSTLQAAIASSDVGAGDTIVLDRATFTLSNNVIVNKAVTIRGAGENWETVLDGNKAYNMSVTVAGALLHNFTLTSSGGQWAGTSGIDMSKSATISNVVFRQIGNLWKGASDGTRFPLSVSAGLVTHCWITNNISPNNAAIHLNGGTVENCYIADNTDRGCTASESQHGIVVISKQNAVLRNFTIVNSTSDFGAVCVRTSGTKVYNNIIRNNRGGGTMLSWKLLNSTLTFDDWKSNCTEPLAPSVDSTNTDGNPLLMPDNLHFFAASPCKGTADAAKAPAFDIFGNARTTPSIGYAEYEPLRGGFVCAVTASASVVVVPATVTLGVAVEGTPAGPLTYAWDLNGDGIANSTGAHPVLSAVGRYSGVSVAVTDANNAKAYSTFGNAIEISPVGGFVVCVSPDGDGTNPYGGFSTGFSSIADGVGFAAAGETVLLDRSTYNPSAELTVGRAITICGVGENWETVLDGKNKDACITVAASGAFLRNFTITRFGRQWSDTLGMCMTGNSIISNVVARNIGNDFKGASDGTRIVWEIEGGTVTHCWSTNNVSPCNAGFLISGGTVGNCYIADNVDRSCGGSTKDRVGIMQIRGGTVRNCTIVNNQCLYGGVFYRNGNGKLYNNIIWGNTQVGSSTANN